MSKVNNELEACKEECQVISEKWLLQRRKSKSFTNADFNVDGKQQSTFSVLRIRTNEDREDQLPERAVKHVRSEFN
ncbi:hypothetical protein L1987_84442 [Smallanthus sonchifolius]|uniref:Uncharacterized protein n=1 Tax=Smallanthus sonchifolius TaxID=185202 RepID=A0ACB8YE28_9ASTR|nr:hypothetical protein L1987_84442 [Smallanthus sonchifolius]